MLAAATVETDRPIDALTDALLTKCARLAEQEKKEEKPLGEIAAEMATTVIDKLLALDIDCWTPVYINDVLRLKWTTQLATSSVCASMVDPRQRDALLRIVEKLVSDRLGRDKRFDVVLSCGYLIVWFVPTKLE